MTRSRSFSLNFRSFQEGPPHEKLSVPCKTGEGVGKAYLYSQKTLNLVETSAFKGNMANIMFRRTQNDDELELPFNLPTIPCESNTEYQHVMDITLFDYESGIKHTLRSFYLEPSPNIEIIQEKIIKFKAVFNGSYFGTIEIRKSNAFHNASPLSKLSINKFSVKNKFKIEEKDGIVESQVIVFLKK
jgi:hypothetical protein